MVDSDGNDEEEYLFDEPLSAEEIQERFMRLVDKEDIKTIQRLFGPDAVKAARQIIAEREEAALSVTKPKRVRKPKATNAAAGASTKRLGSIPIRTAPTESRAPKRQQAAASLQASYDHVIELDSPEQNACKTRQSATLIEDVNHPYGSNNSSRCHESNVRDVAPIESQLCSSENRNDTCHMTSQPSSQQGDQHIMGGILSSSSLHNIPAATITAPSPITPEKRHHEFGVASVQHPSTYLALPDASYDHYEPPISVPSRRTSAFPRDKNPPGAFQYFPTCFFLHDVLFNSD